VDVKVFGILGDIRRVALNSAYCSSEGQTKLMVFNMAHMMKRRKIGYLNFVSWKIDLEREYSRCVSG